MLKRNVFCVAAGLAGVAGGNARTAPPKEPFAHTYSIVAMDSATGEMGVAVQSHWFSVGTVVTWAEAGVGAIATQSFANPAFGPEGLDLLRSGISAQETLDSLIAGDEGRAVRQLAIVDRNGGVAAWTGSDCIPKAGHLTGDGFSVQANLMLNDRVWPAMKAAFEASEGPLEHRLITALEAAETEGGDIRGRQSAALLVVHAEATGQSWVDRKTDLRIDDHPDPVKELRRLYNVKRAYDYMNQGDVAMEHEEHGRALELYSKAFELYPENPEVRFWTAVTLANAGRIEPSLERFAEVFGENAQWAEVLRRIHGTDLLTVSEEVYHRILALEP